MNQLKNFLHRRWNNTNTSTSMSDNVYRTFRLIDTDKNDWLSKQDFADGIFKISGHEISHETCESIFDNIDKNNNKRLTYQEFVRSLHKEMNPSRFETVNQIFNTIDRNKTGTFTASDLDYSKHPDVLEGKTTAQAVSNNYIKIILGKNNKDNKNVITRNEFINYYTDLSMSISSDEYFITIVNNAHQYHISFRKGNK